LKTPAANAESVPTTVRLEWNRAFFAVAFDVYLGTSPAAMNFVGRVNADVNESPNLTYFFTPSTPLQPLTTYRWQVVARTNAGLTANSDTLSFTTGPAGGGGGGGGTSTAFGGTPTPLPGTLQAANFDNGGEGVGYHDLSSGNSGGGGCRATDVDLVNL